jgi:hypothetical protein
MVNSELVFNLKENLPPLFTRKEACQHLGGLFKPNTLKNIDYQGLGPKCKQRVGRKVLYTRDNFIEWLNNYVEK